MIWRVGLAPRRIGTSVAEFQRHWREEHASVASGIPGLRAYLQNHSVLDARGRPVLPHPGFDACSEIAFADLASMDAGFGSPVYQRDVRADEDSLIDKPRFSLLLCHRSVLHADMADTDGVKLVTLMRVHPAAQVSDVLDATGGRYAELARAAGAGRHQQLVPSPQLHAGRPAPVADLVDCLWFGTAEQALEFAYGGPSGEADSVLSGVVFGRERMLATVRVVRALTSEEDR